MCRCSAANGRGVPIPDLPFALLVGATFHMAQAAHQAKPTISEEASAALLRMGQTFRCFCEKCDARELALWRYGLFECVGRRGISDIVDDDIGVQPGQFENDRLHRAQPLWPCHEIGPLKCSYYATNPLICTDAEIRTKLSA
jgi:hypothetical protein